VTDWNSIVHKNVRAADGEPIGNVVAVLGDAIHVETQGLADAIPDTKGKGRWL